MPYSILVWMNDRSDGRDLVPTGAELGKDRAEASSSARPAGAAAGVLADPPAEKLVYGFYENEGDAEAALELISATLREQAPLRIARRKDRSFVIPSTSIRYVVCEEVSRPVDAERRG